MYYEKSETIRIEIVEGMNEDVSKKHSMFILFWMFVGYFIKNSFGLVKVFFKGLWSFIRYGYYRLMSWCETKKEEEVYDR